MYSVSQQQNSSVLLRRMFSGHNIIKCASLLRLYIMTQVLWQSLKFIVTKKSNLPRVKAQRRSPFISEYIESLTHIYLQLKILGLCRLLVLSDIVFLSVQITTLQIVIYRSDWIYRLEQLLFYDIANTFSNSRSSR